MAKVKKRQGTLDYWAKRIQRVDLGEVHKPKKVKASKAIKPPKKGAGTITTYSKSGKSSTTVPNPDKPSQLRGFYISGPRETKDIKDIKKFRQGIDKVYKEHLATKGIDSSKILYGGNPASAADREIRDYVKKNNLASKPLSAFDKKIFKIKEGTKPTKTQILDQRETKLSEWDKRGVINRVRLGSEGEVKYPKTDTDHWYKRWKALETEFGRGKTKLIKEAFLDEVEDAGKGYSLQNSSKQKVISRKGIKTTKLPMLDQGTGTTSVVKANPDLMLAGLEFLEDREKYQIEINKRSSNPSKDFDWLGSTNRTRIANLRGDSDFFLKSGERVSINLDTMTEIIETESNTGVGNTDKAPGKVLPGFAKSRESVANITSNTQIDIKENQDLGYTGKNQIVKDNSFTEFFQSEKHTPLDQEYEGKGIKDSVAEVMRNDRSKISQEERQFEIEALETKELEDLDKLQEKRTALDKLERKKQNAKSLGNYFNNKNSYAKHTILTEQKRLGTMKQAISEVGDRNAKDQITVLESYTSDPEKKKQIGGKVKGTIPHVFPTKEEIRAKRPQQKIEQSEWIAEKARDQPNIITSEVQTSYAKAPVNSKVSKPTAYVSADLPAPLTKTIKEAQKSLASFKKTQKVGQNISKEVTVKQTNIKNMLRKNTDAPKVTPTGQTIEMTKSKISGEYGLPRDNRKLAIRRIAKGARKGIAPTGIASLNILTLLSPIIGGYADTSRLNKEEAEAKSAPPLYNVKPKGVTGKDYATSFLHRLAPMVYPSLRNKRIYEKNRKLHTDV